MPRRRAGSRLARPSKSSDLAQKVEDLESQVRFLRLVVTDMRRRLNLEDFAAQLRSGNPEVKRDEGESDE